MNPKYRGGSHGIAHKDSDVFYFYRKGFGREDSVKKIKLNPKNSVTKRRKRVPEVAKMV